MEMYRDRKMWLEFNRKTVKQTHRNFTHDKKSKRRKKPEFCLIYNE